jgi:putative membrane protein
MRLNPAPFLRRCAAGVVRMGSVATDGVIRSSSAVAGTASRATAAMRAMRPFGRSGATQDPKLPAVEAAPSRRSRRSKDDAHGYPGSGALRWLAISAIALAGVGAVLAVDWIVDLYARSATLAAIAAAAIATSIIAAVLAVRSELGSVARLKSHVAIHESFGPPADTPLSPGAMARLRDWLADLPATDARQTMAAELRADLQSGQVADLVERHVLREMDRMAVERIRLAVMHSFGLIALSPTPITDTALFAWRATRLVREIAGIYGLRPSAFGAIWLLRQVISDAALIAAADLATDALATLLGDKIAARLSSPIAEGSVAAYRMARFGLLTIERCRPVPFRGGDEMGLRAVLQATS